VRTIIPSLVTACLLLVLAGCTSSGGLARGTCLEFANGEFADLTSVVGCDEEHRFDVVGTVSWPEMQASVDELGAEAVYAAITDFSLDAYWEWVPRACEQQLREAVGLSEVSVDGKNGEELQLNPAAQYYIDHSLASLEVFLEGNRSTTCSVAWTSANNALTPLAHAEGATITGFVSGELGVLEAYSCFTRFGAGDQPPTACDEPHNGEYLLVFDGGAGLSSDFIESFDPVTTTAPDYSELDAFCESLINAVHPQLLDDGSWMVWGDHLLSFGGGWDGFDGTFDPDERYMFYCGVLRSADDSVTGSVVIGDIVSVSG
jgi:hypothetical protein